MVMITAAISGARWLSPPWRARANRVERASHRLDVSCQVQGRPPKRRGHRRHYVFSLGRMEVGGETYRPEGRLPSEA